MSEEPAIDINRLIGEFMDLHERWQYAPQAFDWEELRMLARNGAQAYNEGAGPSFHALVLDEIEHGQFHERFLVFSMQAGFDPFRLVRSGSGSTQLPVIDHDSLAWAARSNPFSARMHAVLLEAARPRFAALADAVGEGAPLSGELLRTVEDCAPSIPVDLLERIAPDFVGSSRAVPDRTGVDPVEGYLSSAEVIVDASEKTHG